MRKNRLFNEELMNAKNLMDLEIKERKRAVKLVDKIIEIVKEFDGKVMNCRFEKALNEKVDSGICVGDADHDYNIKYYFHQRYCMAYKDDPQAYKGAIYVRHDTIHLTSLYQFGGAVDDNNRIIADRYIQSLLEQKADQEKKIAIMKKESNKLEQIDIKFVQLHNQLLNYVESLDYTTREYLDIDRGW